MGLLNFCSLLLFYLKLFKRRFVTIIRGGKGGSGGGGAALPVTEQRGLPGSKSSSSGRGGGGGGGGSGGGEESWDTWTNDAKQELTSVKVVSQDTVIEERKIDHLFSSMAPVHQPKVVALPPPPRRAQPSPLEPASAASKFAFNDGYSAKAAELDDWVDGENDNAWEQEDIDEKDIAALEKRKAALERRERRQREAKQQREGSKDRESRKLGVRA